MPTCPRNIRNINVCANVMGLIRIGVNPGQNPNSQCCSVIRGLVDLDAAVCLCEAIKVNFLGINVSINILLKAILNYCGKQVPTGYRCE
ncbi:hypothetical protein DITRI_Ditri07aG0055200 [Diplodiscus trichospermus]